MEPCPGSRMVEKTGGEVPRKLALTTSGLPPPPPCRRRLPGSPEKGTEIGAGFLTLIWVEGEGWGVSTQPSTTQTTSCGFRSPHQAHPPQGRSVAPHLKYLQKRPPPCKGNKEGGRRAEACGTPTPTCSQLLAWGPVAGRAAPSCRSIQLHPGGPSRGLANEWVSAHGEGPRVGPRWAWRGQLGEGRGCRRPRAAGPTLAGTLGTCVLGGRVGP